MTDFIAKVKNFLYDLKDVSILILTGLTGIFAALFFIEKKKNTIEKVIVQNNSTIQKVDIIDTQIANATLQEKEQEDAPVTTSDLLNFLNKPK
jgi:type II restriction/modification system DNA methylase subunit YeeA